MKYLYYVGWNAGVSVGYRNSIGLAVSDDGGRSFTRMFKGPVMDRTKTEPQFCSSPCVMIEEGVFRMWYLSGIRWQVFDGRSEPIYHLKYAESEDGIHWERPGIVCIERKSEEEGGMTRRLLSVKMAFTECGTVIAVIRDYRQNPDHSYRIGYAESEDGLQWERLDELTGINVSENGWDSQMVAYPYVF